MIGIDVAMWAGFGLFCAGAFFGQFMEAVSWREKGDHEYMNRKESRGRLYIVTRAHPQMRIEDE